MFIALRLLPLLALLATPTLAAEDSDITRQLDLARQAQAAAASAGSVGAMVESLKAAELALFDIRIRHPEHATARALADGQAVEGVSLDDIRRALVSLIDAARWEARQGGAGPMRQKLALHLLDEDPSDADRLDGACVDGWFAGRLTPHQQVVASVISAVEGGDQSALGFVMLGDAGVFRGVERMLGETSLKDLRACLPAGPASGALGQLKALQQLVRVLFAGRDSYGGRPDAPLDITARLIEAGAVPEGMEVGDGLRHALGGAARVLVSGDSFAVVFEDLPPAACIELLSDLTGLAGLKGVKVNSLGLELPVMAQVARGVCRDGVQIAWSFQ